MYMLYQSYVVCMCVKGVNSKFDNAARLRTFSICLALREAEKKSSALNGRAIKRGGGEGVKDRAIKEKRTFIMCVFTVTVGRVPRLGTPLFYDK